MGFTIVVMSTTLDVFSYIKSVGVNVQIFIHETEFLEQVFTYSHTFTKVPSSLSSLTLSKHSMSPSLGSHLSSSFLIPSHSAQARLRMFE